MSNFEIYQFTSRQDNFCVLIYDPETGHCASIDAPDEQAIVDALEQKEWNLTHILVTHWHLDHVEGIPGLKKKYNCEIIGPAREKDKIGTLDKTVEDGDIFEFANHPIEVISTPGHTLGMINFYIPEAKAVFAGDTLFALGCGRVFEGTGAMMWESLQKLAALPQETAVYCGHEYTLANGNFALTIDPDNARLQERMDHFVALREAGKATLPTTIGDELQTNPFLRVDNKAIRKNLNMVSAGDAEVFSEIRTRKDNF